MLVRGRTLTRSGRFVDRTLRFAGRALVEARDPIDGDPPPRPGLLVPGLINAHTHLELSWLGSVPGGDGLPRWIERQMAARRDAPSPAVRERATREAASAARSAGTAAVVDVCGEGSTATILLEAGLSGVCQVELLGLAPAVASARATGAASLFGYADGEFGAVWIRPTAHAPYSTLPDLARAALARGPVPATVHLAEDPEEAVFLASGEGDFADFFRRVGIGYGAAPRFPGGPLAWLRAVGGARPGVVVVHGVTLAAAELTELAEVGVGLVLCPRSNLHVGGALPDVPAALRAGLPLAIGTDSLASCPDLDPLAEVVALAQAFPDVDPSVWWRAVTAGGARLVGLPAWGALDPGTQPGLLWLHADEEAALHAPPARTWLIEPGRPTLEHP